MQDSDDLPIRELRLRLQLVVGDEAGAGLQPGLSAAGGCDLQLPFDLHTREAFEFRRNFPKQLEDPFPC